MNIRRDNTSLIFKKPILNSNSNIDWINLIISSVLLNSFLATVDTDSILAGPILQYGLFDVGGLATIKVGYLNLRKVLIIVIISVNPEKNTPKLIFLSFFSISWFVMVSLKI